MKTIDEVIYWYENRKGLLTGLGTKQEMEDSILYHLKEYQKLIMMLPNLVNAEPENYLEKLGVEKIDLTKISHDELSESDKEFISFVESDGGVVTEIYHF